MIITVRTARVSQRVLAIALGALLPIAAIGQQIYGASASADDLNARLAQAQTLAWNKRFPEAEAEYRSILAVHPESRDARLGLARVVLWSGRYAEARKMFVAIGSDADAMEGAATAAYWSGDFRSAQREFAAVLKLDPNRTTARQSLAEIDSASRPLDRIAMEGVDDDQPYRTLRGVAETSFFSDPLTRWDVTAGSWWLNASDAGIKSNAPFVSIANQTSFPSTRLVVDSSIGLLRYPDDTTRPVGSAALTYKLTAHSSASAAFEQYEMLATATAITRHISAQAASLQWKYSKDHSWLAAVDARQLRFSDSNRGWAATAYAMRPFAHAKQFEFSGGASVAARDTKESRFFAESVSSQRAGATYQYEYTGAYTPYWTPLDLREVRLIVAADADLFRAHFRFQADGGITRDLGTGFGPESGTTPFPPSIFQFEFDRTYHPYRLQLAFSKTIAAGFSLEAAIERNTTVFYTANGIRASLVRRR